MLLWGVEICCYIVKFMLLLNIFSRNLRCLEEV